MDQFFWYPLPPKQKLVCQTKLAALGVTICIWKNPDTFAIIEKIGSYLEKPNSFEIIRKIGSHLEKLDSFEIIRKNWQSSEKSRQF